MGYPEFGDGRDPPVRDWRDRADDIKQRLKEEGKWPPRDPPTAKVKCDYERACPIRERCEAAGTCRG